MELAEISKTLNDIAKSLSVIAEETKAERKIREENQEILFELETKINDLTQNPFDLK